MLLAAKRIANRRPVYVTNLGHFLRHFAKGRESTPIHSVSVDDITAWLVGIESSWSRATRASRLSTLFAFAVRRGWVSSNPLDRIERVSIERKVPKILTAAQLAKLLAVCTDRLKPWVILGAFVGLRPDEAARLRWESVRLSESVLVVDACTSKIRRRRIVHLDEAAVAWLSVYVKPAGPAATCHTTMRRDRRAAAMAAGLTWTADLLRHTHASMRLARGDSAEKVAADLGNSVSVLLTHYRELVSREDAAAFWALRPAK
jgi:integrase